MVGIGDLRISSLIIGCKCRGTRGFRRVGFLMAWLEGNGNENGSCLVDGGGESSGFVLGGMMMFWFEGSGGKD